MQHRQLEGRVGKERPAALSARGPGDTGASQDVPSAGWGWPHGITSVGWEHPHEIPSGQEHRERQEPEDEAVMGNEVWEGTEEDEGVCP